MKKNKPFGELFYRSLKKTLLTMRIAIILMIIGILQARATDAYSQKTRLSINFSDAALVSVLDKIEDESEFFFMYNEKLLDTERKVTINVKDQLIVALLDDLFSGTDVKFTIIDRKIILAPDYLSDETVAPLNNQQKTVTGTITDEAGSPLPGVNIMIEGTTIGVLSNNNGEYTISVPNEDAVLIFSFIGFQSQKVSVSQRTTINPKLISSNTLLDEVVVTALGIKREAKSIGYSTATVTLDQSSRAAINIGANLLGKVSGMNVSQPASGPGGSSKIRIRGQSSFGADNSPLVIVNGSPINNKSEQTAKGADAGDGLLSINEADIETLTVLKGSAAAALYGYRAKDGAIIITTKSASRGAGIGVEYTLNARVENAIDYTDFQYEYGEGLDGYRQKTVAEALSMGTWSFGEKMDGVPTIMYDGTMQPYSPFKDRVKLFYRPGTTLSNTIAISGGNEKGGFRLSFSNTDATAIVENSDFHNKIINLGLNYNLTKKLSVRANFNYSNQYNNNPVKVSGKTGINETVFSVNNSTPEVVLKQYENPDGTEMHYCRYTSKTNPFWIINKQFEKQTRDRLIANGNIRYDFSKDIYIQGQISQDYYSQPYENNTPTGTATLGVAAIGFNGNYRQSLTTWRETNLDFLIGAKHTFGDFNIGATFGGNQLDQQRSSYVTTATDFYTRDKYTVSNGVTINPSYSYAHKKVNSLYGSTDFSYSDFLFLNFTARNDWFSTLNPESNSYLYPSASLSFVLSDAIASKPSWLDYGKLRLAYAEVGGDTDPYQDALYYSIATNKFNTSPLGSITSSVSPNANLRPLSVKETEVGLEMRTFNSRLNIDVSVYNKNTIDEILNVDISTMSGYSQTKVNVGQLNNRGIELLFTVVPITGNFDWESTINGAYNISKVIELANNQVRFDVSGTLNDNLGYISHEVGKPLASIRVYDYKRDDQGRIVVSNGLPLQGDLITMGSAIPKWTGAWLNTFRYKGFEVFTQIDFKAGGLILSDTHYNEMRFGLTKETLLGREGGVMLDAVNADGTPNTKSVTSYAYFAQFSDGLVGTMNVFKGDFIKWRSVSVSYDFSKFFANSFIKNMSASLNVNNVLLIKKYIMNMDPESTGEVSDNVSGLEVFAMPTTRSYGLTLNVRF